MWDCASRIGRRFRALGRSNSSGCFDGCRCLPRISSQNRFSADLLPEPPSPLAAYRSGSGPWSASTGAASVMKFTAVNAAPSSSSVTVKGGPGRSRAPWPMQQPRLEPNPNRDVGRPRDGARWAEPDRPRRRPRHRGAAVISNVDPKRRLPRAHQSRRARPELSRPDSQLPLSGNHRQGRPRPECAAHFQRHRCAVPACCGAARSSPGIDYLDAPSTRRSTGEISSDPYLDFTLPTLNDPSLAPAGAHVMSIYVQYRAIRPRGRPLPGLTRLGIWPHRLPNAGQSMRLALRRSSSRSRSITRRDLE